LLTFFIFINLFSFAQADANSGPNFLAPSTHFIAISDQDFDLIPLLHVIDPDENQTLTWSVSSNPIHGEITLLSPTWLTPGTDIYPVLGSIIYCANRGYNGPDNFTMNISDGYDSSNLNFTVDVYSALDQWDGTRATSFAGGTGTQEDPYLIATGAQLAYLADYASDITQPEEIEMPTGLHFSIEADIDLNHYQWRPIGSEIDISTVPFRGNVHGNGHTISNLSIGSADSPSTDYYYLGLFGYATDTIIEDLYLENVSIYSGRMEGMIGGLVGLFDGLYDDIPTTCILQRCSVSGTLSGLEGSALGLLAGALRGDASECSSAGSIFSEGLSYAGGLIGYAMPFSPISNCFSTASLIAEGGEDSVTGGLIGAGVIDESASSLLFNCYATGNVISKGIGSTGNLVGFYSGTAPVLDTCYFNSQALLINNGEVIAAKGLGDGVEGTPKTLAELQAPDFLTLLNNASLVIWDSSVYPANHGLPLIHNVPANLGNNLMFISYDANGATSGIAPYDTGSYPVGATIWLAPNSFGLNNGEESDFLSWNTQADGSGTTYLELADFLVDPNSTFYATYEPVITDPIVTQAEYPSAGFYYEGQTLVFRITFDQPIYVLGELNLLIDLGQGFFPIPLFGGNGNATIEFRYLIERGDESTGTISMGSLSSIGQIVNSSFDPVNLTLNNILYRDVYVDAKPPTMSAFTGAPGSGVQPNNTILYFYAVYHEGVQVDTTNGSPTLGFSIGGQPQVATYNLANSDLYNGSMCFTYTVSSGDLGGLAFDPSIAPNGALLQDLYGNIADIEAWELQNVQNLTVEIDAVAPEVTNLIIPANGTYVSGQNLDFIMEYDEIARSIAKMGGEGDYSIALKLYLETGEVYAPFVANWDLVTAQTTQAFTNFLLFRYTIASADRDADGIELTNMLLVLREPYLHEGTHTVQDLAGNSASISLPSTDTSGIKIVAPPVVEEPVVVPPQPAKTSKDEVLVNGESNLIAIMRREGETQNQQILQVDGTEARNLLEQTAPNILFTMPFEETSDQYAGSLNGETVKLMEERKTILQIQTPMATYTIPARQINIDDVAEKLGNVVDLQEIEVRIEVFEPSAEDVHFVQDAMRNNKVTIFVQPVEFEITCTYEGQTVAVERFNGYVERLIPIPYGVNPNDISTAVVLHKDGSIGHVPTSIVIIDGKYYARVNSLTNSIYTLVQSAVVYSDTATHWAKAAIEDLSTRLIVEGVVPGKYMPEQQVNRSEFVTMLVKALGLEARVGSTMPFPDVTLQDSFAGVIATAYEYGLVVGDGYGKFNPYEMITREQVMALLTRAMQLAGKTVTVGETEMGLVLGSFTDAATVHDYAKEAVAYCVQTGILVGRTATTLAPTEMITRAEAAALLQRALQHCDLID
jgi:hypothetical protein